MRVNRKSKLDRRSLRRKELVSLAGSLSAGDAKILRAAIKTMRKNWR
jgi:hypothetical protein